MTMRRIALNQRGSAVMEFVLVAPLVILIFAAVEPAARVVVAAATVLMVLTGQDTKAVRVVQVRNAQSTRPTTAAVAERVVPAVAAAGAGAEGAPKEGYLEQGATSGEDG